MNGSRGRLLAGLTVLALIGAVGALLIPALGRDPNQVPSVLVGSAAPDFRLRPLDGGGDIRLSELRGQVVLINFWASWCVECRNEEAVLANTVATYHDRGVVLLGISFQDQDAQALAYAARSGIDWPLLGDPDSRTALAYGVGGIPETFFVDAAGKVRYKQPAALTPAVASRQLTPLLREAGR